MSIVTIFSAEFCNEEEIASKVSEQLGYRLVSREVLEKAGEKFGPSAHKLEMSLRGHASIFDSFTNEKSRNIVYVKAATAEIVQQDNIVLAGLASHLVPDKIAHTLRVCLTADWDFRVDNAVRSGAAKNEKDAQRIVKKDEGELTHLTNLISGKGPWEKELYDIKIPVHSTTVDDAVALICENAQKDILKSTPSSEAAAKDFLLEAQVHLKLVRAGHMDVDVQCENGHATILINKNVMRLEPLKKELEKIAAGVDGISGAEAKAGPGFYQADIYRRQTFELPQRVLLVDDETEYVQTLSERLQMRDFGTAVAYDGEQAISMVENEEPEVMVLDLRMPGIDGMEVLRRLKKEHPEVEVIILTGHGTETDRQTAMGLGAFAYLEKPVSIDRLSETMKAAYSKIRKEGEGGES